MIYRHGGYPIMFSSLLSSFMDSSKYMGKINYLRITVIGSLIYRHEGHPIMFSSLLSSFMDPSKYMGKVHTLTRHNVAIHTHSVAPHVTCRAFLPTPCWFL
ncbi:hypothetical protein BaRGS_00020206 [Batillaria attramentaria]|uniref:Uncharacterized protein n=1 Tax=Batillaria attramentaria TaxID=370345 RepID=A0ABD0KNH1_9CAEN